MDTKKAYRAGNDRSLRSAVQHSMHLAERHIDHAIRALRVHQRLDPKSRTAASVSSLGYLTSAKAMLGAAIGQSLLAGIGR